MSAATDVVAYYDRKTDAILRKYGPGPRVHFHGGLVEFDTVPSRTVEGLRRQLVQAQENLLREAAHVWDARKHLSGTILDVGCGLGGGSIFWAQEYGARVFALTIVPDHLELIDRFASEAGVANRVIPVLGDACAVPGDQVFDAVVAIESACYLEREAWFSHLSLRTRPGSRVFIAEPFAERDDVREPFDRRYETRIGTVDEYLLAAVRAGFRPGRMHHLTSRTARFWELSALYSRRVLDDGKGVDEEEARRLEDSIRAHTWFLEQWRNSRFTYALLSFVHPSV